MAYNKGKQGDKSRRKPAWASDAVGQVGLGSAKGLDTALQTWRIVKIIRRSMKGLVL
jgi:hypothetical protein